MSNESSASETTPLRRPESRISEEEPTSPMRQNSNVLSSQMYQNSDTTINFRPSNTIQIHFHNNNNSFNNNNSDHGSETIKMEHNKKVLYRVGFDFLVMCCVGFPTLFVYLFVDGYRRGFFCDDESLMHPYKNSTVPTWMLYFIGLVLPVGVMISIEICRSKSQLKRSNGNYIKRQYVLFGYDIPEWLVESYKKIGIFGFGALASQFITNIAKYSIGRLRPHFFAVCQPVRADGSTCADAKNAGIYITDFTCTAVSSTARMLKEVRISFPSGHSSFTFFTMVYLVLFLQSRWPWRSTKLLRHAIQFGLILVAWFTALSRVSDYKHHWSDVLAGSLIGVTVAIVVSYRAPKNWFNWKTVWPIEEEHTENPKKSE